MCFDEEGAPPPLMERSNRSLASLSMRSCSSAFFASTLSRISERRYRSWLRCRRLRHTSSQAQWSQAQWSQHDPQDAQRNFHLGQELEEEAEAAAAAAEEEEFEEREEEPAPPFFMKPMAQRSLPSLALFLTGLALAEEGGLGLLFGNLAPPAPPPPPPPL